MADRRLASAHLPSREYLSSRSFRPLGRGRGGSQTDLSVVTSYVSEQLDCLTFSIWMFLLDSLSALALQRNLFFFFFFFTKPFVKQTDTATVCTWVFKSGGLPKHGCPICIEIQLRGTWKCGGKDVIVLRWWVFLLGIGLFASKKKPKITVAWTLKNVFSYVESLEMGRPNYWEVIRNPGFFSLPVPLKVTSWSKMIAGAAAITSIFPAVEF